MKKFLLLFSLKIIFLFQYESFCQDTIVRPSPVMASVSQKKLHQVLKATIIPVGLAGLGVLTMYDRGPYSSMDVYDDIHSFFKVKRTYIDDFLSFSPYAGLISIHLLNDHSQHDRINMALLMGKSLVVNTLMINIIKKSVFMIRPDSVAPERTNSFPSGHTAYAFSGATLIHKEFGAQSIWYSIGAYTIASTVGVLRMLHNRHWLSDVLAGAGVGILSTNLVYLTHQNRWGKKRTLCFFPGYSRETGMGVYIIKRL